MVDKNPQWTAARKALSKVQVHLEFMSEINRQLRADAAKQEIKPGDLVRKIVGLNYQASQRQRISLHLSDEDFTRLAKRYQVSPQERDVIRRKMVEEVQLFYHNKSDTKESKGHLPNKK